MAVEVKLPRLGQGMEAGTIVRWLKSEGDNVEKGEPLYELDTDKVTQEVESDAGGVLLKIVDRRRRGGRGHDDRGSSAPRARTCPSSRPRGTVTAAVPRRPPRRRHRSALGSPPPTRSRRGRGLRGAREGGGERGGPSVFDRAASRRARVGGRASAAPARAAAEQAATAAVRACEGVASRAADGAGGGSRPRAPDRNRPRRPDHRGGRRARRRGAAGGGRSLRPSSRSWS